MRLWPIYRKYAPSWRAEWLMVRRYLSWREVRRGPFWLRVYWGAAVSGGLAIGTLFVGLLDGLRSELAAQIGAPDPRILGVPVENLGVWFASVTTSIAFLFLVLARVEKSVSKDLLRIETAAATKQELETMREVATLQHEHMQQILERIETVYREQSDRTIQAQANYSGQLEAIRQEVALLRGGRRP